MSTITVTGDITFHYTDSDPVDQSMKDYTTIVMLHGNSFHSGIFTRMLPLAKPHGCRIICVSRRPYEGSTPYTPKEISVIKSGSEVQLTAFLHTQGVLLALFLDAIIQRHALSETGGIALVGWSLGNTFAFAILAAIHDLPPETRERLKRYLHSYICWDAPSVALGLPQPEGAYAPLFDLNIAPQDRGGAFAIWASGYFQHGDQSSKDYAQLNQHNFDIRIRKPTLTMMTDEEIHSNMDSLSGMEFDTPIIVPGPFSNALYNLTSRALFDSEIREEWGRLKICMMYCEETVWNVIHAMWVLEGRARQAGIDFEFITGANHFLMWDDPERFMSCLKKIIFQSRSSTTTRMLRL